MLFNMEKKKSNKGILLLAVTAALSLLAMVWVLVIYPVNQGKFTPPAFEPAAQKGVPEVPEGLSWSVVDAKAFRAGICKNLVADANGQAAVYLTNPADSGVWLKLRVLDEAGNILGETGLLRPDEYVTHIRLTAPLPNNTLLLCKLMAYEPFTYHSAGAATLRMTTP